MVKNNSMNDSTNNATNNLNNDRCTIKVMETTKSFIVGFPLSFFCSNRKMGG
jgi:hypothetical protein